MIQKIYETDPLICPRCNGAMHVIACIEDDQVIKKILKHLDLWHVGRKPRPVAHAPPIDFFPAYEEQSGPSAHNPPSPILLRRDKFRLRSCSFGATGYISDPDYPAEAYFLPKPTFKKS